MKNVQSVAQIIRGVAASLPLTILEVGARSVGSPEPLHGFLDLFPGSRVAAIEVDPQLCTQLNSTARPGLRYYASPLGRSRETRPFYETVHPACSSLYEPNEPLLDRFNGLEFAKLQTVSSIETVSLDEFATSQSIGPIDFIKIDVQGAELDVFAGGTSTLASVLGIVSEVEFVPLYRDQPLFGDVCTFLAEQSITFHKFLTFGGRSLRPILINNDPHNMTQHLWSDALFFRDLAHAEELTSLQLLKTAVFANLYKSADVAGVCLLEYDRREGTNLAQTYLSLA